MSIFNKMLKSLRKNIYCRRDSHWDIKRVNPENGICSALYCDDCGEITQSSYVRSYGAIRGYILKEDHLNKIKQFKSLCK